MFIFLAIGDGFVGGFEGASDHVSEDFAVLKREDGD